ncbi:hypothetical protein ACP4OV_012733 [Aristida adscensionis]
MMGYLVVKASTASMVISTLISFLLLVGLPSSQARHDHQEPPAIFIFGDGALDVGNNNYLEPRYYRDPMRADHRYYGIDSPDSKPTGRFSNGYNIADFIAKTMDFEMSPPPYLSLTSPIKDFTGANYASEGAGIWNITNEYGVTIHLLEQVDYFANTSARMMSQLGEHELRKLISKSLFLVSIGTIDLFRIFSFVSYGRESTEEGHADVQNLITSFGVGITALHNMGARKFGIINIPPLGCTPAGMQVIHFGPGGCDDNFNMFVREFNDGLKPLMAGLASKLDGLHYSIADSYNFSNATFQNPSASGFVNTDLACCKGPCDARFEQYVGPPCQNRTEYWMWDNVHTTEQAAKLSAAAFYDGTAQFTTPVNFKKLVQ